MAKNTARGLGALAALGALSYHLSRGDKGTDTGRLDTTGAPAPAPSPAAASDDIARFADVGTNINPETGQPYSLTAPPGPAVSAARAAPSSRAASVAPPPPAVDTAAMFRASERAERATPAMRDPNISAEVARRTGVNLNSPAGAGRGIQGGPTAEELDAYASLKRGAGAGRGVRGGPTAAELADYREQQRINKLRASGGMRAKGGAIKAKAKPKKMASGGMTSASKRADGIASKGKTKCKMY